jgi:hypothetical protein
MVESGTNNHNVLKADLTCNVNKQKILTSVVCYLGAVVCYVEVWTGSTADHLRTHTTRLFWLY